MSEVRDDGEARQERARAIGLFRYQLIREAADPGVPVRARGRMIRALAQEWHVDPFGQRVRVLRPTLDRWVRAWRAGGFEALVPSPRQSAIRTDPEILQNGYAVEASADEHRPPGDTPGRHRRPAERVPAVPRAWLGAGG